MDETIGERIRRLREAERLTQAELAQVLQTTEKSVSNWESGRHNPRGSMGALRDHFGPAIDGGAAVEGDEDPVVAAIKRSDLTRGNKAKLTGHYYDMLDDQQERGAG